MQSADILITHGHIITVDGANTALEDGALAITSGKSTAIGPTRDITEQFMARPHEEVRGHADP